MKKMTNDDIQKLLDDIDSYFGNWGSEHYRIIGDGVKTIIKKHLGAK